MKLGRLLQSSLSWGGYQSDSQGGQFHSICLPAALRDYLLGRRVCLTSSRRWRPGRFTHGIHGRRKAMGSLQKFIRLHLTRLGLIRQTVRVSATVHKRRPRKGVPTERERAEEEEEQHGHGRYGGYDQTRLRQRGGRGACAARWGERVRDEPACFWVGRTFLLLPAEW